MRVSMKPLVELQVYSYNMIYKGEDGRADSWG